MKTPASFGTISAILWLIVGLFWPLFLSLGVVATASAANSPFNWKVAIFFLILFNGWCYYALYRGALRKLAQREAEKKEIEKKQGTQEAMKPPEQ